MNVRIKYFDKEMPKLELIGGKSDWIDLRAAEDIELKKGDYNMYAFDSKELKNYKGYGISKAWRVDSDGERIKKYPFFYLVDDGDDFIGEEYDSLENARKFIDTL